MRLCSAVLDGSSLTCAGAAPGAPGIAPDPPGAKIVTGKGALGRGGGGGTAPPWTTTTPGLFMRGAAVPRGTTEEAAAVAAWTAWGLSSGANGLDERSNLGRLANPCGSESKGTAPAATAAAATAFESSERIKTDKTSISIGPM